MPDPLRGSSLRRKERCGREPEADAPKEAGSESVRTAGSEDAGGGVSAMKGEVSVVVEAPERANATFVRTNATLP